jgi:hypothetical protein
MVRVDIMQGEVTRGLSLAAVKRTSAQLHCAAAVT